jgi:hypothetical protein
VENPTWFFIADINPDENGGSQTSFRIEWDTSQITDGNYNLRVIAEYRNEAAIFELVSNLRIRNLSPVETSTPALLEENNELVTPTITQDIESEVLMTPTPLPLNSVVIKSESLSRTLLGSVVFVVVVFVVGGVYWLIRFRSK